MPALFRVAAALAFAACAVPPRDMPPQPPASAPPVARSHGAPTRILAAHAQLPADGGQREYFGVPVGTLLYVVFSRPLDPAALIPGRFVVLARDGTRRVPIAASLAPSSERDELRALELVIPAPQRELVSVTVAGQLFDADGRDIEGQSADVVPADAAPWPVAAELVSVGTDCPPAAPAGVRVWWSAPVAAGAGGVRLLLADGRALPPVAVADVACAPEQRLAEPAPACDPEDDNVLDYCTPVGAAIERIELDDGAARDRSGSLSAAGSLQLSHMSSGT
ncbi:hypothetical protein [Nannocystis bainbridge]|uniref:Lipoprotein n=1 Tax=Nannocystis bainbridge TaxID=2995303 RepID=A0ABT5DY76_9BACT|nr:hypothetical protein [Nannocystis bainbridge]MDC0718521.1 hypothetical protein [Nannocystis bainbridge]